MSDGIAGGRGRGRGGGVAVLPAGMWETLNNSTDQPENKRIAGNDIRDVDSFIRCAKEGLDKGEESAEMYDKRDDAYDRFNDNMPPTGFGRSGGRSVHSRHSEKGRGGLDRDMKGKDWDCPSCSNVNWSWRSTCNKCNTPKPYIAIADNVVRDGAAGGFNERQDRVSATAVEIDEEGFDDFGRRVKKINRVDKRAKEEAALKRMSEKYKHLLPSGIQDADTPSTLPTNDDMTKASNIVEVSYSRDDSKPVHVRDNKFTADKYDRDNTRRERYNESDRNSGRQRSKERNERGSEWGRDKDRDRNRSERYDRDSRDRHDSNRRGGSSGHYQHRSRSRSPQRRRY